MKTIMVAHRGAQLIAPENTITAFRFAMKKGFKAIECDVQLTKDGRLVIIHDETVDRTTNGKGWVSTLTANQISGLSIEGTEHIPFLDEVINEVVTRNKAKLIIEIKADTPLHSKKVASALAHYINKLPNETCLYIEVHSFWYEALRLFTIMSPSIVTAAIINGGFTGEEIVSIAASTHSNGVSLGYEFLSSKTVRQCHKSKLFVDTWAIPDGTVLKRLKPMSVNAVVENFTGRMIR